MKNLISRSLGVLAAIYLLANSSWIYAASYSLISTPCKDHLVDAAQVRVSELFGSVKSRPIFACTLARDNWLNVEYGQTNFSPGFQPAIRIGPAGMNSDVIAHEWAHAELYERVGFIKRELDIPTWFDEGLAMQVDYRDAYGFDALESYNNNPELKKLDKALIGTSNFFAEGLQGRYHYAVSRCLVKNWLQVGQLNQDRLSRISKADFEAIFDTAIHNCNGLEKPL